MAARMAAKRVQLSVYLLLWSDKWSKMERALNPRLEKETIYEIYRACRLCGAGAGYKMPIMQNVIDLEDSEINLSKKIRECIQIEVKLRFIVKHYSRLAFKIFFAVYCVQKWFLPRCNKHRFLSLSYWFCIPDRIDLVGKQV